MIRFRRGNVPRVGMVSGANSLTTAPPPAAIARARPRWPAGYRRVVAAADHRDGRGAEPDRGRVGRGVDAEREPGDDRDAEPADGLGDPAGGRAPDPGGATGPDDRDRARPVQRGGVPAEEQDRRRQIDPSAAATGRPRPRGSAPGRPDRRTGTSSRSGSRAAATIAAPADGASVGPPPSCETVAATRRGNRSRVSGRPQDRRRAPEGRDEPPERDRADAGHAVQHDPRVPLRHRPGSGRPPSSGRVRAPEGARPAHPEHQPASRSVIRSTGARNRAASSRWTGPTDASPARSAIVRATRSRRSMPRPDSPSRSARMMALASASGVHRAGRPEDAAVEPPVAEVSGPRLPSLAGRRDPPGHHRGPLRRRPPEQDRRHDAVHADPQVDPVPERPGHAPPVPLRARAADRRTPGPRRRPARTGTGSSPRRT